MIIIAIITFGNAGFGETLYQNNGFFILILTFFGLWMQINWHPYITDELNSLELNASMIVSITIFGGLFSSICHDLTLQTILMIIIILLNIYFLCLFFKHYIQAQMNFAKDSTLMSKMSNSGFVAKLWKEGLYFISLKFF